MTKKHKKTTENSGQTYSFDGTVLEIRYYSEDSSWGKLKVKIDPTHEIAPMGQSRYDWNEETGGTEEVVVVNVLGKMPKPEIGMKYEFTAKHSYNDKYREEQFDVSDMKSAMPKTIDDQVNFLRAIVTENQARSLLAVHPNIVEMVMNGDEVDLTNVDGIKEATFEKIQNKILENFAIGDILSLLVPIGISLNKIRKLLDGEKNIELLKQKLINNPYVLVEIPGISFAVADKIATQLNPTMKVSEGRLMAFCRHYLKELGDGSGDTWTTIDNLKNEIIKNVGDCEKFFTEDFIGNENIFHVDSDKIGLMSYYRMERYIWEKAQDMSVSIPLEITEEQIQTGILRAEEEQGFQYTEEQKSAIIKMTKSNFVILSGYAGVGKSVTARGLLKIYSYAGYDVRVAAFSAKAALRAQETTGFQGMTIHRMLGIGVGQEADLGSVNFESTVLFIDESAMNPLYLMNSLFESCDYEKTKLILSGDEGQLNPVGAGNVFGNLIKKQGLNINILEKIQRQAADSGIINDANLIRKGISPVNSFSGKSSSGVKNDLFYVFKEDKEEIFRIAVQTFLKSASEKGVDNVVLLTAFKSRGINNTYNFNKIIQREINKENESQSIQFGKNSFWFNDKVIQMVNNYEKGVFNGFTGYICEVGKDGINVNYDSKIVKYTKAELKEIDLAYSLTPWKFQGSEISDVIVAMDSGNFILLSSKFLYSALTRAKERALILSDAFAFKKCLEEDRNVRNTWLEDMV